MFNVTFQERTQCLMVMIQDGQFLNAPEKPLHIIRDPMRVQRGRDLVQDLWKRQRARGQLSNLEQEILEGDNNLFKNFATSLGPVLCYVWVSLIPSSFLVVCNNDRGRNNTTLKWYIACIWKIYSILNSLLFKSQQFFLLTLCYSEEASDCQVLRTEFIYIFFSANSH